METCLPSLSSFFIASFEDGSSATISSFLDNAAIHVPDNCVDLADLLWNLEGPDGLPFPTRTCVLVQKLQTVDLSDPTRARNHFVAIMAEANMCEWDHSLMVKCAKKRGY
jgi:hypothetical protein